MSSSMLEKEAWYKGEKLHVDKSVLIVMMERQGVWVQAVVSRWVDGCAGEIVVSTNLISSVK